MLCLRPFCEFNQVVDTSYKLVFLAGNVDSYVVVPFSAEMYAWNYRSSYFIV